MARTKKVIRRKLYWLLPAIIMLATACTGLLLEFGSHASTPGAGITVTYRATEASGVMDYDMVSPDNSDGAQTLRVLRPTNPAGGVPHNILYSLPVAPGADNTTYGDGLDTLAALNAQNQYNLTIVEPSFGIDPWYADNPLNAREQEETFMFADLEPWVKANLATSGNEQNWLIGFSKSGLGGMDLLLKHPDVFTLGAFWDFPAEMPSYSSLGTSPVQGYGTDANYQANYKLTQSFVAAHSAQFLNHNRVWIGGYSKYGQDIEDFDLLLTAVGVKHTLGPMVQVAHSWTSGWVPGALAALNADSAALSGGLPSPSPSPTGKIGDINNDNLVNVSDLSILLSNWGSTNAAADVNKDGTVNVSDLSILLSHWGV